MANAAIRVLLKSRTGTFGAIVVLLVVLLAYGKRVSYEQSIHSFFADDDPYMQVYQQAAKAFGDDNFVFLVYDDPELVSAKGMERVGVLAAAVAPAQVAGVERVESLDAMPLVWAVDDALLAIDRLPAAARRLALAAARRAISSVDLKTNAMTVAGAARSAAGDARALEALKARLTRHPLFGARLSTRRALPRRSSPGSRRPTGTTSSRRSPPCDGRRPIRKPARPLAAGGRRAPGAPGRRLRGHRGRRPAAGRRRHDSDRNRDALGGS